MLNAGSGQTLSVVFTPTDTTDYTTASGSTTIYVAQANPIVTWPNPASISYGTALSSVQLDATANTAGTFAYAPAAGTVLGAGPSQLLSVVFTPTDSTDYVSANGYCSISVTKAAPTLGWTAPSSITYGTALSATQLDATANTAGTFTYTPAAGTLLNAGAGQLLSVSFKPTDTADYTSNSSTTTTLTVLQATPILAWATPSPIAAGTALSSTQLDATANTAGTFAYTPSAGNRAEFRCWADFEHAVLPRPTLPITRVPALQPPSP